MLVVMVFGVVIFEWTYRVVADSYTVTAVVVAAPVTTPAIITSPTEGFAFNDSNIVVDGYCPDNSYVNLYDNGLFSGTSMCTTGGTFQVELSLYIGTNALMARPYNISDQPGPDSSGVTVTYEVKAARVTPVNISTPTQLNQEPALPLLVVSNFHYQTFVVNNTFSWPLQVQGGTPPITVTISWGDTKETEILTNTNTSIIIKHSFSQQGYYPVIIKVTDADGNTHILQLAALIRNPGSASIYTTNYHLPTPTPTGLTKFFDNTKNWLWVAWPSLGIITLMISSFWLGERQEYKDVLYRRRHAKA